MAEENSPNHFLEAKLRVKNALKDYVENNVLFQRFPCTLFEGCKINSIADDEFGLLFESLLHLCSISDRRRWSSKGFCGTKGRGITSRRGFCSRRGSRNQNLVRIRAIVSSKYNCTASFTLLRDGNLVFKNSHEERCLVDPKLDDDAYVFRAGLSPTKKASIISTVSDLLCDYSTTNAVACRQIENSLLKSGDTGFRSGRQPQGP